MWPAERTPTTDRTPLSRLRDARREAVLPERAGAGLAPRRETTAALGVEPDDPGNEQTRARYATAVERVAADHGPDGPL